MTWRPEIAIDPQTATKLLRQQFPQFSRVVPLGEPLDETQRARLIEALSAATGRRLEVHVVVDPTVVGGVVARVGDEIFDGSVRSRLRDVRERLAG